MKDLPLPDDAVILGFSSEAGNRAILEFSSEAGNRVILEFSSEAGNRAHLTLPSGQDPEADPSIR